MAQPEPIAEPSSSQARAASLFHPRSLACDFPLVSLGPTLTAAASAIAVRTQTPSALAAHAVLSVAALIAQRHIDLRLPTGEIRPVSAFFLTIAESGEHAGAATALSLAPLRALEARTVTDPVYDLYRAAMEKEGRSLPRLKPHFLREGAVARSFAWVDMSPRALLVAEDCTALVGHGPERKRLDALGLCALWNGANEDARLSAHVVATPRDARAFLADPGLARHDLFGRLLAVYPASLIGARTWAADEGGHETPDPALTAYAQRLVEHVMREEPNTRRVLALSRDAAQAWFAFAREIEAEMADGARLSSVRALAGGLPEHAARLAAVTAFFEDPGLSELSASHMTAGMTLARYYAAEALHIADFTAVTRELEEADLLLAWLQRTRAGQVVELRDIYRAGPPSVRNAQTARLLMAQLQRHGAVRAKRSGVDGPKKWEVAAASSQDAATMSRDVA
ncbi:MAG: DUF3987 domain-containing protein [Rhodospirillaceae bacterium]